MEYAVIKTGGKQYKVVKGSVIEVDKISSEIGKEIVFNDVFLLVSDGRVEIGRPTVKDAKVKAKVLSHIKGDKIRVAKFKAKSKYRRVMGFRQSLSRLQITEMNA